MLSIGEQVQREAQAYPQHRCAAHIKVNLVISGFFDLGVHLLTDFQINSLDLFALQSPEKSEKSSVLV